MKCRKRRRHLWVIGGSPCRGHLPKGGAGPLGWLHPQSSLLGCQFACLRDLNDEVSEADGEAITFLWEQVGCISRLSRALMEALFGEELWMADSQCSGHLSRLRVWQSPSLRPRRVDGQRKWDLALPSMKWPVWSMLLE